MARRRDLRELFTFGGRVPATVGLVLGLMLVSTVATAIDGRVARLAALRPDLIVEGGQVWRLVTWPIVQTDALALLFGGFMLWQLSQQLSYVWSERRFAARLLAYTIGAAVGTTLLSILLRDAYAYVGIWPVVLALLVAAAMLNPDQQVNFWGVLPMTGKTLALLAVGAVILSGLFEGGLRGIFHFAPHLFAIAIAFFQGRSRSRGRTLGSQVKDWLSERDQRRRASHLKVVKKDGDGRWLN